VQLGTASGHRAHGEADVTAETLRGLSFPFRIEGGAVVASSDDRKIAEDVAHLISVRLGERTMLREYGGGVQARREQPNSPAFAALVRYELELALRTFMPDLRLTAPLAVVANEERLTVSIEYVAAPGDVIRRLEVQLP
jgi:phage baseplate assembly protein W